jgi:hypothetical protein
MHSKSCSEYTSGGILMTAISEIQQTLAGLKSAQASFETFVSQTDNEPAKQMYQQASQQTQAIVDTLSPRVQQILEEEPQYKE